MRLRVRKCCKNPRIYLGAFPVALKCWKCCWCVDGIGQALEMEEVLVEVFVIAMVVWQSNENTVKK